ncbi:MAG: hypothetical protein JNL32_14210 [Candidatus Kapabacteria bacterium]|nr:hypothetical protein [Candidatus Kapabacteria bacterium]
MSRTLLNALWDLEIPARKLQLMKNSEGKGGGHTLVEYYDGGKWKVIAPSDSAFVWRNKHGEIATAQEIQESKAIFSQIYVTHPSFNYLFDNPRNINWDKLPTWMIPIIKFTLGNELFNSMQTPRLYDMPRHALLYFFLACTLIGSLSIIILRRIPTLLKKTGKRDSSHSAQTVSSHPVLCNEPYTIVTTSNPAKYR